MAWWKQTGLAALVALAAVFAFARLWPGAPDLFSRIGVSPSVVAMVAGTGASTDSSGAKGEGAQRPAGGQGGGSQAGRQGGGPPRETLVETAEVKVATINDRITAIGDGEALRSVIVVPLASGVLSEVVVNSGDRVRAGDVLARLDSQTEIIARDRAALSVASIEEKVRRTEKLASSRAASEVALSDARSELETAKLALRDAEVVLQRRAIVAPFDGVVGIIKVEAGQYVTPQTEVATLDDRSAILVDFWVPERFAAVIKTGDPVEALPIAIPGSSVSGEVAEIASRIEQASRTLQIRARIANPDDVLRPGMSFRVVMRFPGDSFPAVDPLAIQWSSDGAYVWKAQEGKALRTPVRIVQRNSDLVLVDGALVSGEAVVTEGVQTLREGAALKIASAIRQPEG
jgi:RND family efflux transporter MFP subunit